MSVIEISAVYHLFPVDADLTLSSQQTWRGTVLTLIHERFGGDVTTYDFAASFRQVLAVKSGESLTLIARVDGHIIGCLVNEIDASESARVLLRPKGGFNLIVYQARDDEIEPTRQRLAVQKQERSLSLVQGSTPHPLTPATLLLSRLLEATAALYQGRSCVPGALIHLAKPLDEAIEINEEAYSRQMLGYLCAVLEELGLAPKEGIQRLYEKATSIMRP